MDQVLVDASLFSADGQERIGDTSSPRSFLSVPQTVPHTHTHTLVASLHTRSRVPVYHYECCTLTEESVNCGNTLSKAALNCSPWCCSSNIHPSCASVAVELAPFTRRSMIYSTLFQRCNLVSLDLTAPACHHFAATVRLFGEVKPDRGYTKTWKRYLMKGLAFCRDSGEEGSGSAALSWGYTPSTHLIPAAASVALPCRCPLLCLSSLNRLCATYAKLDG